MSFGDISKGVWAPPAATSRPSSGGDEITKLSLTLQNLQRECQITKDLIATMRRRKIGPSEKHELSLKIKSVRETESELKNRLDAEYQKVEAMPRPEAAPKRTTLGKLMKDFEKVKVNIQAILNESALVKVVNERGEVESFARTGSAASSSASTPNGSSSGKNTAQGGAPGWGGAADEQSSLPAPPMNKQQQAQHIQQLKLQPLLQGKEVDDAILEERERDIKKMNHDLVLVNEMFQDMAHLVKTQGEKVDEIAVSADKSHERAQAGLQQVNQAAAYQPGCTIA